MNQNLEINNQKKFFYKILPSKYISELYVYFDFSKREIGSLCMINFHGKKIFGLILDFVNENEERDLQSRKIQVKQIENVFENLPLLTPEFIKFLKKTAYFQIESPGFVLGTALSIMNSSEKTFLDQKKINKILDGHKENQGLIMNSATLNEFQKESYIELRDSIFGKNNSLSFGAKKFLLEGETGSGKTEVYLELIKDFLNQDSENQILILLPEIALTNAVIQRIQLRLNGVNPLCFHHDTSLAKKKEVFLCAVFGKARVFVGARSAIFLPFKKLSLIIIDEEHDPSFKQEQGLIYHLIDLVFLRAKIEEKNIRAIILSSATPSLETIFLVKQKEVQRVFLKSLKNLDQRMKIEIIDMGEENSKKPNEEELKFNPHRLIVSNKVLSEVKSTLEKGFQAMIFLNRRGYNHLIICKNCQNKLTCPNCSIGLVFHKEIGKFYCHYCAFSKETSKVSCSNCLDSSKGFKFLGFGVERVYEIFQELFPEKKIRLLSSDLNESKGIQEIISEIESGKTEIIIGTQILAKGHNFPKLGFLGVIDGGLNFSGIDLRSSEKTYQILHQILGRIGRFDFPGNVMIQTYEPKNLILKALKNFNKTEFYSNELQQRKFFEMPPFFSLIKISFSGAFKEGVEIEANKFAGLLPIHPEVKILGPSPSSIFKINKKYRFNVFLQSKKSFDLHGFLISSLKNMNFNKKIMIKIDVNPMNFV